MKKVAIVYHYIAHYREPIFEELINSESIDYYILSGITSDIKIKKNSVHFLKKNEQRLIRLNNIWFFNAKYLWQRNLLKLSINSNFDAIIFLGSPYFISTWLSAFLARLNNIKVYYWMHGVYNEKPKIKDYFNLLIFYKLANGFFLYGNRSKNILNKFGYENKNLNVIYNSLNYTKSVNFRNIHTLSISNYKNFRQSIFNDDNKPIVIFIGRINSTKRIDMLFKSLHFSYENNLEVFNIILVGEGEEKEYLYKLSKELNIENNIKFIGEVYEESEISYFISFSDLCVVPGDIGLTAIHSLSYGTPAISHNNLNMQMPESEAIIPSLTGDFYQYNDFKDLSLKIHKWFKRYPFKDANVSQNCFNIIDKHFNPKFQKEVFDTILKRDLSCL